MPYKVPEPTHSVPCFYCGAGDHKEMNCPDNSYPPDPDTDWDTSPEDCPCGAPWFETKFYPPDGVGFCEVCGRCTEEGD